MSAAVQVSPLTAEQQVMVEGVIKLVHRFTRKYRGPSSVEPDDYFSELLLAVVNAAGKFEPGRISWPSFAFGHMRYRRSDLFRSVAAQKRTAPGGRPVNQVGGTTYGDREGGFLESAPGNELCPSVAASNAEEESALTRALETLQGVDPVGFEIVRLHLDGHGLRGIAKLIGRSQEAVRQKLEGVKKRLRKIAKKGGA